MPEARKRIVWTAAIVAVALAMIAALAAPYASTAAFLLDLRGEQPGALRRWMPARRFAVASHDVQLATRDGALAARVYEPASRRGVTIVVVPGVHAGGLDEPRLARLSAQIAATGARVVAVPLPDLRRYRLTAHATNQLEDAALAVARDVTLAPEGQIGLIGVSFSGGLALVAAGRPSLADKLRAVVAIGAHADLPRVMRYLCTGTMPDGTSRPPHDYGAAILLLHVIGRLVPPEQVATLDAAIVRFLDASSLADTRPQAAQGLIDDLAQEAASMPEPSRRLMTQVLNRDIAALGPLLLPYIEEAGGDPALSPARSPATTAPVYLLHGADDNVIPTSETPALAAYLRSQGTPAVKWLITPLVQHATVTSGIPAGDAWRAVRFWTSIRRALD